MPRTLFCLAVCLLLPTALRAADEWPQFRGPAGDGHTAAAGLPLTWGEGENVVWKTPIEGRGHSSPVISGNDVWLTTAVAKELTEAEKEARLAKVKNPRGLDIAGGLSLRAVCIDRRDGRIKHDVEVFTVDDPEPIHSLNSYASPTPVLEAGRVHVCFGTYGLACLDARTAEVVWTNRELKVDHQNGPGSSPILWNDLLIVNCDGIDAQFVAALDRHTGEVAWKTQRSGEMNPKPEFQKAYCTPVVVDVQGKPVLVSPGADWVYGYDPATGRELWRAAYGKLGFSTVPRPVVGHGMVFVATSYVQSRLVAVKYDGTGDVTDSHVVWTSDRNVPKKPSMLLVGDLLFTVQDNGIVSCLDATTGEDVWRERIDGRFSASPLLAEGRNYVSDQDGRTTVFAAGRAFEPLAENELEEGCMASPAVAGSALFLRTKGHLYRIEGKAP